MSIPQQNYLLYALTTLTVILSTSLPVSARVFPNVSSIPIPNQSAQPRGAWDEYRNFTGCRRGDAYDGLSSLKNYFHYFGYIPNVPPSNFTNDFDEELEAAIKTYQKNFNLNITGELDNSTINQIVLPRCGVADIINGTSTMNSGKSNTTTSNSPKFHTVAHYSFFEGQPRWPVGAQELTYAFDPDNNLDDVVKNVFGRAFSRWSEVTTISFRKAASYESADITIGFYSGDHGDGVPFDGLLGTLAHAFAPMDGRFHVDQAEDWVASGDVTKASLSNAVDLESVAMHEIGHLFGLGHTSVEEAIMYPSISAKTRKVELNEDDVQGIQELYGSNPNYTGTHTSKRRSDSSNGFRHVGSTCRMVFLFALVGSWICISASVIFL